jgi:biotin transporter BioY
MVVLMSPVVLLGYLCGWIGQAFYTGMVMQQKWHNTREQSDVDE